MILAVGVETEVKEETKKQKVQTQHHGAWRERWRKAYLDEVKKLVLQLLRSQFVILIAPLVSHPGEQTQRKGTRNKVTKRQNKCILYETNETFQSFLRIHRVQ